VNSILFIQLIGYSYEMTSNTLSLSGLSLRDLEYALSVAELGHFGRAAAACGVSQPGLSEQIRKLEAVLGCSLFERGRHGARLTTRGAALMPAIERVVVESRTLIESARADRGGLDGEVRLGIIPTLGPYYVPSLLRRMRETHPATTLRLSEERTAELAELVLNYTLDAMVVALPVDDARLTSYPLFFEPFRVLVPATHPLATRAAASAADLDKGEILLLDSGHCLRDQTISMCRVPGNTPGEGHPRVAASLEMLRHMVAAGEGIAVMPALAVDQAEGYGLTRTLTLTDLSAGRMLGLVWRAADPRAPYFTALAQGLATHAPGRF